jgi:hypothetical protein
MARELPRIVNAMRMARCARSAVGANMQGQPPSITETP